jgi:hypothetical protein
MRAIVGGRVCRGLLWHPLFDVSPPPIRLGYFWVSGGLSGTVEI